jgi:membrane fusion protein, multidrug efflux system
MTRAQRIIVAASVVAGAFGLYEVATSFLAYTADAYVRSDLVAVAPRVSGQIIAVNVEDNQTVAQGDLLVMIDPVPFQVVADQHRAELEEARAQVAADQDAVTASEATLTAAVAAAGYAQQNRTRVATLATADDVSRADLQKAEDDLRQADAAVDAGQAAIARAQATVAMRRAAQATATAVLGTAEWQLAQTKLTAPVAGTITHLTVRPGDFAQAEVPLIGIVDAGAWRIVANYKQSFLRGFATGETAWVWLDSEPWHLHKAQVTGIARGINREPSAGHCHVNLAQAA